MTTISRLVVAVLSVFFGATEMTLASNQDPVLTDIDSIDPLRSAFNSEVGMTRLILILSPT